MSPFSGTAEVPVNRLAIYDETQHKFVVEPGLFDAMVGGSSKDVIKIGSYEVK